MEPQQEKTLMIFKETKQKEFTPVIPKNNLTGKTIGNFNVMRLLGRGNNHIYYECECRLCGNIKVICYGDIGRNKGCGCESIRKATKHGECKKESRVSIQYVYNGMIQRCYNPNATNYHRYGGRGITVCDQWRNSIITFLKDMGPRPRSAQVDRINNDGNYEPSNCRWATPLENARNNNRTLKIKIEDREYYTAELTVKYGISDGLLRYRLKNNIPLDKPKQVRRYAK